jgi:hypothetical protein
MNKFCPRIIMLLYALSVVAFLAAAFASVSDVLKTAVIGLALAALATLLKVLCCDCTAKVSG